MIDGIHVDIRSVSTGLPWRRGIRPETPNNPRRKTSLKMCDEASEEKYLDIIINFQGVCAAGVMDRV